MRDKSSKSYTDAHDLNYGVTRLLNHKLQVDLNGSIGLNSRASDYALGTGIAYRF